MRLASDIHPAAPLATPILGEEKSTGEAERYADYKIIRRKGAVVGLEPDKIAVAMTKAFLRERLLGRLGPDRAVARTLEANGRPVCSTIGRPSMSARIISTGPGPFFITATRPVPPTPSVT